MFKYLVYAGLIVSMVLWPLMMFDIIPTEMRHIRYMAGTAVIGVLYLLELHSKEGRKRHG